ncbi:SMP-30/gluconolactonase/LRE family protein [Paracoccus sp. P2]|uniref:SMP-30/gluconolactonase/LRE family protein n=1 Tax=Paracoccus sp. P2 TaxID=3248840 RepID=UPI00391FB071
MVEIRLLADCRNHLGENPLWDVQGERLYWIDSTACEIWACRADGSELRTHYVPTFIGSMALRKGSGAILALANGFHFYDFASQETTLIANPLADKPGYRFNDGKVDRAGRFFAGCMGHDCDPSDVTVPRKPGAEGPLYRIDADLSVHQIDAGMICFNAPCWSPDNRTFYYGDSEHKVIWASDYDLATGGVSNRRLLISDQGFPGTVDGATVDSEGFLWNAKVLGGRIIRYAPDGSIDRVIEAPVRNVTSVMFGGPDLDVLYVTSMAKPVRGVPTTQAGAGGLFAIHGLGVRGLPETRFAA